MKPLSLGGALLVFTACYFAVGILLAFIAGLGNYSLAKEGVGIGKKEAAKMYLAALFVWPWLMVPDKRIAGGDDE